MTDRRSVHAINGKIGALESWARLNKPQRAQRTAKAREGLLAKFEREADPQKQMSEQERQRAAEDLLHAHMLRMAQRSVQARTGKTRK